VREILDKCRKHECLTALVGFRGCDKQSVCQYVDGVPGIREVYVANIYDQYTYPDFTDFEESVKVEAYQFFRMSLIASINKYKTVQTILLDTDNPQTRRRWQKEVIIPPQIRWIGMQIEVPYNKDVSIEIESIYVNSAVNADTTLGIFDLYTGEQVHSSTISLKIGFNEIAVDKTYLVTLQGELIFVGIRQDNVTLKELHCGQYFSPLNCSCDGMINEFTKAVYNVCHEITASERLIIPQYTGVCIKAKVKCDIDNLICRFKDQFAEAYKYAEALQYMKQGLVTDRRNWQVDNLDIYKLREIMIPATEKMFNMTLNSTVKSLKQLWENSICFVCDPNETGAMIDSSLV